MLAAWSAALNAAIRSSIIRIRFVVNYKSRFVSRWWEGIYLSVSAQSRLVCVSTATSKCGAKWFSKCERIFAVLLSNTILEISRLSVSVDVCVRFSFVYICSYVYRRIKVEFGFLSGRAYTQTHTPD